MDNFAILCENVHFAPKCSPFTLRGVNMKVATGQIYGLVGPSGCGKTTLQRCIWGYHKPQSGHIFTLGHVPGWPDCGIPGPEVGYMPQNDCLDDFLTISETLCFFSTSFDRDAPSARKQIRELLTVVGVSSGDHLVSKLSGGQRRRLSFACTCLSLPKLLLLDEPTVGSDPMARMEVWKYLRKLRDHQGVTIVITTHYTQEISTADRMGLMIHGDIIYEGNPVTLQIAFQTIDLEEAVCHKVKYYRQNSCVSDNNNNNINTIPNHGYNVQHKPVESYRVDSCDIEIKFSMRAQNTAQRREILFSALFLRSFWSLKKFIWSGIGVLLAWIIVLQFLAAIMKHGPKGYKLGYHNPDMMNDGREMFLLNKISPNLVQLEPISSKEKGLQLMKRKEIDSFISFSPESRDKFNKWMDCIYDENTCKLLNSSLATFYTDKSDPFASIFLEKVMDHAIINITRELSGQRSGKTHALDFFRLENSNESIEDFNETGGKSLLWKFLMFTCIMTTVAIMIPFTQDDLRKCRIERFLSMGYSAHQIVTPYPAILMVAMIVHNLILVSITIFTTDLPCGGCYLIIACFTALVTMCGVLISLIFSLAFIDPSKAFMSSVVYTFTASFLDGTIWTRQALPYFMTYSKYLFPYGSVTDAILSIVMKNAPPLNSQTYHMIRILLCNILLYLMNTSNQFQSCHEMSKISVRCENLWLSIQNSPSILCGVNIVVGSGQIYGLVGPSGCGKTTLQRCIWGFYKPDSGRLSVLGQVPGSIGSDIPGPELGYMPQEDSLDSVLSVEETLSFYRMCFDRRSTDGIEKQLRELLEIVEVDDPKKLVQELSGGQKRRLSFACACIGFPRLLLLDEPTVGSDPLARRNVWMYLDKMCHYNGVTAIITTHYTQEVAKADRMGLMIKGRIIFEGSPKSLESSYVDNDLEGSIFEFMKQEKWKNKPIENKRRKSFFQYLPDLLSLSSQGYKGKSGPHVQALLVRVSLIVKRFFWVEILMMIGWIFLFMFVNLAMGNGLRGYSLAYFNPFNSSDVKLIIDQMPPALAKSVEVYSEQEGSELLRKNKLSSRVSCLMRNQDCNLAGSKIGVYQVDQIDKFASIFVEKLLQHSIRNVTRLQGFKMFGNPNSADFFKLIGDGSSFEKSLKISSIGYVWKFLAYASLLNTAAILIPFTQDDRRKKRIEKFLSLGFTRYQIVAPYPVVLITITVVQNWIILFLGVNLSGLPHGGQYASIGLYIACQTVCGVLISLIISLMFADSSKAFLTSVVYTFSACFLGSVIWPREAMPYFLSNAWYIFPYGRIGDMVTALATRELSILSSQSIEVLAIVFLNIAAYLIISMMMIKYKSFS
ncbi:ATP-binding cassette sub-family A member 9-like [Brevipalpus obovatus]|uniref:ATP-binding cassette sub-family A member 9-like n=1 Tax=Brevipalpus obovatus TaxID=246614 RepID=UPI003D9EE6F7